VVWLQIACFNFACLFVHLAVGLQVRYHPDKVPAAAPLAERVRAEEISKILNSWNTSSLR
jgi:hypothetical protein